MLNPPKSRKFRVARKGRNRGMARSSQLHFLDYGIVSDGSSRINARQIEATRRALIKVTKRGTARIIIRVFPDIPVSKKPLEVRQGRGKGPVDHYAFNVKPGTVIMEIGGIEEDLQDKRLS